MAKRDRASGDFPPSARGGTNEESGVETDVPDTQGAVTFLNSPLLTLIEQQREELMKAEAVMHCMLVAMETWEGRADYPYLPNVVEVVYETVHKTIDALDAVNIKNAARLKPN